MVLGNSPLFDREFDYVKIVNNRAQGIRGKIRHDCGLFDTIETIDEPAEQYGLKEGSSLLVFKDFYKIQMEPCETANDNGEKPEIPMPVFKVENGEAWISLPYRLPKPGSRRSNLSFTLTIYLPAEKSAQ